MAGRRKRIGLRAATLAVLAALVLGAAASRALGQSGARGAGAEGDDPLQAEAALAASINEFRAGNGLATLHIDDRLARASRRHAANMAGQGTLSHVLDGQGPGERALAEGFAGPVAENIAAGDEGTAPAFFDLWASSELHRANMLGTACRELGVGCARGVDGRLYCAAMFGGAR
ncbi:MAG TPA: CAP domain-containing protein [bacterium]